MTKLDIAFSPCPNDTFLFADLILNPKSYPIQCVSHLFDIEKLNEFALKKTYPVTKLSFSCLGHILNDYILLPVGSSLGFNNGPKIIAKNPFDLKNLSNKVIAVPGKNTTTNLLLSILLNEPQDKIFCRYDEVLDLIDNGTCDCGLFIHETRFTFKDKGFIEICDLGEVWQSQFNLPLPLGALAAKRELGEDALKTLTQSLELSLNRGYEDPESIKEYIVKNSIEKDWEVIQSHIDLYVNQETKSLSEKGKKAIVTLFKLGAEKGFFKPSSKPPILEL